MSDQGFVPIEFPATLSNFFGRCSFTTISVLQAEISTEGQLAFFAADHQRRKAAEYSLARDPDRPECRSRLRVAHPHGRSSLKPAR